MRVSAPITWSPVRTPTSYATPSRTELHLSSGGKRKPLEDILAALEKNTRAGVVIDEEAPGP
jgi:hypothetical protein